MQRRGFTVVEIIITVTVMGILLLLAVVNVNSSQISARDDERAGDVEVIALAMESFYTIRPNSTAQLSRYPSTNQVTTEGNIRTNLPDATIESFIAPGSDSVADTFTIATNADETVGGVTPQPTTSQYVYQPLDASGNLCTTSSTVCRKFNIFYRLEADNTVQRYESRNR